MVQNIKRLDKKKELKKKIYRLLKRTIIKQSKEINRKED